MGLVDDEDLVAITRRSKGRTLDEIASIVNATVTGRVHLHDVERSRSFRGELPAGFTHAARSICWRLLTVQATREDSRRSGFPASSRARKEIRVRCFSGAKCGHQRLRDVLLANHILKLLGPVTPVQCHAHRHSLRASTGTCFGPPQRPLPLLPQAPITISTLTLCPLLRTRNSDSDGAPTSGTPPTAPARSTSGTRRRRTVAQAWRGRLPRKAHRCWIRTGAAGIEWPR